MSFVDGINVGFYFTLVYFEESLSSRNYYWWSFVTPPSFSVRKDCDFVTAYYSGGVGKGRGGRRVETC